MLVFQGAPSEGKRRVRVTKHLNRRGFREEPQIRGGELAQTNYRESFGNIDGEGRGRKRKPVNPADSSKPKPDRAPIVHWNMSPAKWWDEAGSVLT